ncbi:Reverse transcriptase Ty1/copia-type domain-containing protein [Mycena sanguinolenta]|uniref:Reverse transcriptase Ty1/copia-type domain-containing protein n=1 Tax=Mycena sanguinolenta TaxID=230812 RepID=A0A8H6Z6F8_9AGAR|nr:Reverse transcriptase Ty1/copia-type domain-containing protein [Mycena sanguinolenta]
MAGDTEADRFSHAPVTPSSNDTDLPPAGEVDDGAVPESDMPVVTTADEAAARAAREPWAMGTGKPTKTRANVALSTQSAPVPQSYQEAMEHPEVWMDPMQKEFVSLVGRETWELVDKPEGANVVDCKWVFAVKYNTEGEIIKRKARLVAKGFQQIAGVDFFETYAGVVRYESLRMLWAICVQEPGWETVYMRQPPGFTVPGMEDKVCRMLKSLYGFMQSGRNWSDDLDEKLTILKWIRSRADPAIRLRITDAGKSIMGIYTDDIEGMSTTQAAADEAQAGIKSAYEVTDVPRTSVTLGMAIEYDQNAGTLSISSRAYLERVLERYGMSNCNPKSTPLPVGVPIVPSKEPLSDHDREYMADKPYREAVGSIQHAANTTRPDLAFSVGRLATCVGNPQPEHWKATQHLLAYVKGTLDYKITYRRDSGMGLKPIGWVDSDYGSDLET